MKLSGRSSRFFLPLSVFDSRCGGFLWEERELEQRRGFEALSLFSLSVAISSRFSLNFSPSQLFKSNSYSTDRFWWVDDRTREGKVDPAAGIHRHLVSDVFTVGSRR